MILTEQEQREIVNALRDLLRSKPGAIGNLRRLAKRILDRIDSAK